ncbi:MAG TPA: prepilin peptidase [Acidobacteriaceae bacterium]|jgi:leader peptidase (prepilin peptidase)/N-methyltransferase|nr:prepilin peptidase [Acidobacteriaceae bacterium]
MPLQLAFELPAFLLGLLFGSFLNVCISRLPEHRSISRPRSHCPRCLTPIRWYDNVPLLSWILLRARCRHCKAAIPWRYPLIELATGLWFALAVVQAFHTPGTPAPELAIDALLFAILGFLLLGLLVMDWRTQTLPNAFTLTGIAAGFFLACSEAIFLAPGEYDIHVSPRYSLRMSSPGSFNAHGNVLLTGPEHIVYGRLLAICLAAAVPLFIRWAYKALRHREGLGLGDVKLLAMIAAFLGFWNAIFALFAGVVLAALYAITLLARRRATATSRIPLGTFLCVGGLLAALLGAPLIAWYRSLL